MKPKSHLSTTERSFLETLENWLQSQAEILVLIRYSHAAGAKDFELFSSFAKLSERLHQLPPSTSVIAFRQPQLPLRGIVDRSFIERCLSSIPDSSEYLILETVSRKAGGFPSFHHTAGESHEELREDLADLVGSPVAVGLYPPFWDDIPDVVAGVVPYERGDLKIGVY